MAPKKKAEDGPKTITIAGYAAQLLKERLPVQAWLEGQPKGAQMLCRAVELVEGPLVEVKLDVEDHPAVSWEMSEIERETIAACMRFWIGKASVTPHIGLLGFLKDFELATHDEGEGKPYEMTSPALGLLATHLRAIYSTGTAWYDQESNKPEALGRSCRILATLGEDIETIPEPTAEEKSQANGGAVYNARVREWLRIDEPATAVLTRNEVNTAAACISRALRLGALYVCPASMLLIKTLEVE